MIIAYAPNRVIYNTIMKGVHRNLTGIKIIAFKNCDTLRERMKKNFYYAGVCFRENKHHYFQTFKNGTIPIMLNYGLIYPSELRFYRDTHLGNHWHTNGMTDEILFIEHRNVSFLIYIKFFS